MIPSSNKIVIVSVARTPIGKFRGSLASLSAVELGSIAIRAAVHQLNGHVAPEFIREAYIGNVVSAGIGQAPARQAALGANLPIRTVCTTINKVCASGMKSVMLAAQSLLTTYHNEREAVAVLAGGMESMSNIPHYLSSMRNGTALGNAVVTDGLIHDGLWDPYNNQHMGNCGEKCAKDYSISRDDQDNYAIESYRRAEEAVTNGVFKEVVPVSIPSKRGSGNPIIFSKDEEPSNIKLDKIPTLKPAFDKQGSVTAANASPLNDGACALILMTEDNAKRQGLIPLARILSFADAERDPVDFTVAPSLAVPIAVQRAGLQLTDVEYHEINEAFAVVALANMQILNLDACRVNVHGGAVALGHPIGMSGARIIGTLLGVLQSKDATIGCASICNGGGGASAIVIERLA